MENGISKPVASEIAYPAVSHGLRTAGIVLAGSALVAVCSHITLPLWFTPVPLTLQPFAVVLLGLLLRPRLAAADTGSVSAGRRNGTAGVRTRIGVWGWHCASAGTDGRISDVVSGSGSLDRVSVETQRAWIFGCTVERGHWQRGYSVVRICMAGGVDAWF